MNNIDDLSKKIRNHLPKHVQEIFKEAFNKAWDEYKEPQDRKDNTSREEISFKVAWAAVKKTYQKNEFWKLDKKLN